MTERYDDVIVPQDYSEHCRQAANKLSFLIAELVQVEIPSTHKQEQSSN